MTVQLPETLLAEILTISGDAIICVDSTQRIIFYNEGAATIFGYSADEVLGRPLDMLLPMRSRASHRRHVARFVASSVSARRMGEREEISGVRKSGEEFPAEAAIAHITIDGQPYGSVVLRDVTDRKRAEQHQQILMDISDQLAASIELSDTMEVLARAWLPHFGEYAVVEVIEENGWRTSCASVGDGGVHSSSDQSASRGAPMAPLTRGLAPDDQSVVVLPAQAILDALPPEHRAHSAAAAPVWGLVAQFSYRGETLGRISVLGARDAYDASEMALATDIARRATVALVNARLHHQLQHALRARDETLSVVSHDLRNPVSVVKMLANTLLRHDRPDPLQSSVAEQLTVIGAAAEQMDVLIQDLLDVSRAEAGQFSVSVEPVPADHVLRDALRTLAPLADEKKIVISTDWTDSLPNVQVDPERIARVLSNVVGNAIKFTPTAGRISISAIPQPHELLISVEDSGPGILPEDLPHVFDRYWQSTRKYRGAGLGLPIAKAIVEAHHGRIWAESTPGQGAVFRFTLPV